MNWVDAKQMLPFVCVVCVCCARLSAADWRQFRHDAGRTASSPDGLPENLNLLWIRELPKPRPAFPSEVRLSFDVSYEPVVMGKTMFVASMVSDTVTALDTETGEIRWTFFTDGPVRFGPVAANGKVYAVSDDGFLYCLHAKTGKRIWKFRGLPSDVADRKLLGNKRLISLWPARGGPVLLDGVIYFAAGIWPADGVFVHALDAETGEVVWSNTTSNRIPNANMDHGVSQIAGLTPQGYLAIVDNQLVVPCGAQLPAFFNPQTGKLGPYMMGWGGREGLPKGSWFVAGAGKYLSHSGDLYDITRPNDEKFHDPRGQPDFKHSLYPGGFTRLLIEPNNQRALGEFREPVITEEAMYFNDGENGIVAYDLTSPELVERSTIQPTRFRANDRYPDKWKANLRPRWTLDSQLTVHIKAGQRLYCGGPGRVQAVEIPEPGDEPYVFWERKVEGIPHRILAADDKLFVVTKNGRILAFSDRGKGNVTSDSVHLPPPPQNDDWTKKAGEILYTTGVAEGYALVLGIEHGRLIEELVRQSQCYVVAVDSDATKVARLRETLHRAQLYGTRATAHVGDPHTYPFPPFMANLVICNSSDSWDADTLIGLLRPYGGVACLIGSGDNQRESMVLSAASRLDTNIRRQGEFILFTRYDALPGSADWTHEGASAANDVASQDEFVRAPLGLLWFDSSMRWPRKPGSAVVRVANGRVFVLADTLHAIDVYTGRRLWETELPFEASEKCQMVVADGRVYLASSDRCVVLDSATGKSDGEIDIPFSSEGEWSNLRVRNGYVIATFGKVLVCLDANTRTPIWTFQCGRAALSTAVGQDRIFCAELVNERRGETAEKAGTRMRAFALRTGELLWETAGGAELHYSPAKDMLVTSEAVYRGSDGGRIRSGVVDPQIAGEKLISGNADVFSVYDLGTGAELGEQLTWFRRGCTGLRSSCNLVTTRFNANAAYVDLESREITPLWNIRPGCNNNLYPANGLLNVPNVTGGCECNYTPVSKAFAPVSVFNQVGAGRSY